MSWEALCDPRREVRTQALVHLKDRYVRCADGSCRTFPEVARAALPHARRALGDPDPEVRITGARAIELLASDAQDAMRDLADALGDPDVTVRAAVKEALEEFGSAADTFLNRDSGDVVP